MAPGATSGTRPLVTLVLRVWVETPSSDASGLRLQATQVQTGDESYFRTIDDLAHHIEGLINAEAHVPIDFAAAFGRSKRHD